MNENTKFNAAILIIGNEILSGRTQDTNSNFIAKNLTSSGIKLEEIKIIQDHKNHIINSVKLFSKNYSYVFTTGGIGPTHDDITSECVAEAFNKKYEMNKEAFNILKKYLGEIFKGININKYLDIYKLCFRSVIFVVWHYHKNIY